MIMNPIAKFVVAALLLTGTTAGTLVPAVNNAPATTPPAAVTTAPQSATELTAAEATAIALEHAGLTEAEVTGLKTRWEMDDGIPEWEVEFSCGDYEFDYTIHAVTGKILDRDKDYEPKKEKPTDPPAAEPAVTKLTKEEALAIALAHAGLTADQVRRIQCEYDVDDGIPEWEVEFRFGNYEFEYTIHAETGKILKWEKELDD